jgi:ferric-dicitrate binding protein FerR (iron transport regulator)
MDLSSNTIEELLSDESFLSWYFKTDPQAEQAWNNRIASDPVQKKLVEEAVLLLQNVVIKEQPVDVQRIKLAETRLIHAIGSTEADQPTAKVVTKKSRSVKWWAAAAIIFLTSIGVWQYSRTTDKLALQTAYGETRQNVLPDGSQVMLNANTTLDYRNWKEGMDREVWVKGEAFFHIKKTAQKTKFIVHTGHFDVVVTGTQFNVTNRNNKRNVLLTEGSVIIKGDKQEVHMKPGDYIELNNTGIKKKEINHAPVLAWKEHKFFFENTPMNEVASLVTEFYGIKVTLADESVAAESITGIISNDNLDAFLQSLEALFNYDIVKSDKEILIRHK